MGGAASFLSATNSQEQPILNLHMQESSDAADKAAMAKSALMQQKKLLALEEHAASEKELIANSVSSLAKEMETSIGAASFLSATNSKEQPILNLHMQESSDAADKAAMAKSALMQQKKLLALEEHAASEKELIANSVSSLAKEMETSIGAASFLSATNSK